MGFFSRGTQIDVSSVTVNLGSEDVNAGRYDAIIYSLLQNTSIVKSLLDSAVQGMNMKVKKAYEYARDEYVLGLPEWGGAVLPGETFLPVVPLRYDNVDLTDDAAKDTPLYITSKKLLKKLSIDIDQVGAAVQANPDIAEVDHAYIMFGVELQTKNNESIRYLNEYFHHIARDSQYELWELLDMELRGLPPEENEYTYVKGDANPLGEFINLTEHGLDITIHYSYIHSRKIRGAIGPKGKATSQTAGNVIIFRLQLTSNIYREVEVHDLAHYNNVYPGYYFSTSLDQSLEADNHNFIIPIHYGIANQISLLKRNILYKDSLRLVINSYTKTKLAWYQSGWFKLIIVIISLVVIYFSWGTLSPVVAGALVALEAGIGALLLYIVMVILPKILMGMLFSYVIDLLAEEVGPTLGIIIGVVVAVYAIYRGNTGGVNYLTGMTTSQMCLSASSSILEASMEDIQEGIEEEMTLLREEADLFDDEMKEKRATLDAAEELLDTRSTINPMLLLSTPTKKIILNESPSDFYDRTIHIGNIGVVALDMATHYHDIMLRLPKPQYG